MWGGPGDIPLPSVFSHGGGRVLPAHRCRVLHGIWCLAGHAVDPRGKIGQAGGLGCAFASGGSWRGQPWRLDNRPSLAAATRLARIPVHPLAPPVFKSVSFTGQGGCPRAQTRGAARGTPHHSEIHAQKTVGALRRGKHSKNVLGHVRSWPTCRGGCGSKAKWCGLSACADATFRRRDWEISSRSTRRPSRLAAEKGADMFSLW